MEANLLIYDLGSTYTKLNAFNISENKITNIARVQALTTGLDIEIGYNHAKNNLISKGVIICKDCTIYSTSSAAGGLRMVAFGYMPRVTAKAAKEVAMNSGARVLEIVSYEDLPEFKEQILLEIKPDIVLLAGGTDGGDTESLISDARVIAKQGGNAVTILAGNKLAQPEADEILTNAGKKVKRVANVMPTIHELNVKPARAAIHDEFIKQITKVKGLDKLINIISDNKVLPTPGAVLLGAELLAKGTYGHKGLGGLIVIDLGGATTDIHSVVPEFDEMSIEEKGLVISNEKQVLYRTVEGNLGMRISASGIVETVGSKAVLSCVGMNNQNLDDDLENYTLNLEKNPDYIPVNEKEKQFDIGLAITAINVALKRHAGHIAKEFVPSMGIIPGMPIGRDLRGTKNVIAVGGIFAHASDDVKRQILKGAFANLGLSLLPENPKIIVDDSYFLYAVGVLAQKHPLLAFEFAKEHYSFTYNK